LDCDSDGQAIAYSPDGALLATSHGDAMIRLWDLPAGRLKAELVGHDRVARAVVFTPDSRRLISTGHLAVRVWSLDHLRGFGSVRYFSGSSQGASGEHPNCRLTADSRELVLAFINEHNDPAVYFFPLARQLDAASRAAPAQR
jgi:WD40 repeat protein